MFSDIQNHWAKECIRQLSIRAIVSGYPEGMFRPLNPVTRAEFAAILSKAFPNAAPVRSAAPFPDVPSNHWAYSAIQTATRAGFFSGYPDGTFKPNQPIVRVQVLVALVSGLNNNLTTHPTPILQRYFDDASAIPNYALRAIAIATQNYWVVNYPDVRRLNPNQNATRGEVAAFICRVLNLPGVPFHYVPREDLIAIAPQFEQADSFVEGRARVKIGDKWGYIDSTGKLVIQPQLNEADNFSEGLALVRTYQETRLVTPTAGETSPAETRGVWLTTTDSRVFSSKESIARAMDFLAETGFNVVFPVVWNNAATLYPSRVMLENFELEIDPRYKGRDPLAELIEAAKRVGLGVIPWFEYGFASSYNQNGGRLLAKKPEWAARDAKGKLLTKNNFEWLNAFDTQVQNFLMSLILEVIKNYDITGIQGDDRLPALPSEGGYDANTVGRYFQQFNHYPPSNPKDAQWLQWRGDLLTHFLTRLYREVIAINPELIISLSPSPYPWGFKEYLQDSQAWIDQGLVDLIHPQFYRRDIHSYKQLVDRMINEQLISPQLPSVVPGILIKIGSYRISPEHLLQAIQYNRDRGMPGEVFFFYEGLREDNDALAKALRSGPYAHSIPFDPVKIKAHSFTHRRIGGQYSYIDHSGKRVKQPQFDWADSFQEERARVKMGYKWGYVDKTGQLVSRLEFDEAGFFSEGLARIRIGSKYGYIDRNGQWGILPQFEDAGAFSQGLAPVKRNNKWGYINKIGQLAISLQFEQAESFSEGLAQIELAGKYGYINQSGQVVILPNFDASRAFAEGLAPVKIADRWGYINSMGQLVIELHFNQATSFRDGWAAVKVDDKWGYINKRGQFSIPPYFDEAKSFSEGLASVKVNGKWGYIRIFVEES
ncbi:WG repeat-containing protein [Coleofasciculus sp. LEGE 07092]|nr:WG repeat-containing protein [Coleofasciculus sp. LEGE 07081]MBE9152228.1 WG repeat-containing protein [Coleofasciculus sp. LEGE 07092]